MRIREIIERVEVVTDRLAADVSTDDKRSVSDVADLLLELAREVERIDSSVRSAHNAIQDIDSK